MQNYSTKQDKAFWLSFQIHGDGSELLEYGLPTPNHYERSNNASYGVYWLVDGYIHTKKGREYLNDLVARFSGAFRIARRLHAPAHQRVLQDQIQSFSSRDEQVIIGDKNLTQICNLKQFGGLPSLRTKRAVKELNTAKYEDNVFWAIKLEAIMTIRCNGWLDRSSLESWAMDVFLVGEHVKDKSTLCAKCRSVFEWYEARNWRVDERESTMSRIEGAAKATAIRQARVKAKIQGAINVLRLYGTKITVRAVAEEACIGTATAQKYLKEIKASGGLGDTPREEQSDGEAPQEGNEVSPSRAKEQVKVQNDFKAFLFAPKRNAAAAVLCNSYTKRGKNVQ